MSGSMHRLTADETLERHDGRQRARVELLDGERIFFILDRKSLGMTLLDLVCDSLDLVERDYFGLYQVQRGQPRVWIDLNKRLSKTFGDNLWDMKFAVKFYPPEPSDLTDDIARNQIALAIRKDIIYGRLECSYITLALLGSYVLQAECGDYCEGRSISALLSKYRAAPLSVLSIDLEEKVEELYQKHRGQTPAEAELNYLENAKRLPQYGAEMHTVADSDDVPIALAVCASAVSIYRDGLLMNRFPWAKILKICYNKRTFTLKLRASEFDEFETHLSFKLPCTADCKNLWRCTVEHHMFYRRESPVKVDRIVGFPRFGSRRVSCRRTLHQLRTEPRTARA